MPYGDAMLIADGRTNTNLGRARHRGTRALHRECRFYPLSGSTHNASSVLTPSRLRKGLAGSAWARLSIPVAGVLILFRAALWCASLVSLAVPVRFMFGGEEAGSTSGLVQSGARGAPLWLLARFAVAANHAQQLSSVALWCAALVWTRIWPECTNPTL